VAGALWKDKAAFTRRRKAVNLQAVVDHLLELDAEIRWQVWRIYELPGSLRDWESPDLAAVVDHLLKRDIETWWQVWLGRASVIIKCKA